MALETAVRKKGEKDKASLKMNIGIETFKEKVRKTEQTMGGGSLTVQWNKHL